MDQRARARWKQILSGFKEPLMDDDIRAALIEFVAERAFEFTDDFHDLSVQGRKVLRYSATYCDIDLGTPAYFGHVPAILFSHTCRLSRAGYSGGHSYEIFASALVTDDIWDGRVAEDVMPCLFTAPGKVCIVAGLLLYSFDMTEENTPWEVGLGFAISKTRAISVEMILRWRPRQMKPSAMSV